MTRYVGFLRAVNVGGTGKLPMADLRGICADVGFRDVQTYIASGNVVFSWDGTAKAAADALDARLVAYAGRPIGVMIRDAGEMARIVAACPFAGAPGHKVVTLFLPDAPPLDALDHVSGANGEVMALGQREIYVHYVNGQGRSKLRIPAAAVGTARNMNTVRKVFEMTKGSDRGS